jgi:surfeit locus 1 family protein
LSRLRFRPPWWAWLGFVPMSALLLGLGSWQLQRGLIKTQLQALMDASMQQAAGVLDAGSPAAGDGLAPHLAASGHYDSARQLLLDNQGHEGAPGYHVWTPLRLDDGALVIVDRGWVPQNGDRSKLPAVAVEQLPRRVSGLWRPLPRPGMRLDGETCPQGPWPRVVQYPRPEDLRCLYAEAPLAGLLLLDPATADGYVRDWRVNASVPPQRHYAYAAQWYAFAATLLFFFVKLNLRRSVS